MHSRVWGVLTELTQHTINSIHTGSAVKPKYPQVERVACTIRGDIVSVGRHLGK